MHDGGMRQNVAGFHKMWKVMEQTRDKNTHFNYRDL